MRLFIALGLALLLAGSSASAQATYHVRLGVVPVDVGGLVYYAADEGFFQKAGIDAELVALANGPAIAAGVASGSVDIGSANALSLAQAHERGLPFVFIAPAGAYSSKAPTAGMVVLKSSPLRAPKELAGKTIAVATLGSLGEIATKTWLDKNGVDSAGVHFIEMPYSAMDAALVAARVDAAVLEEPALDRVLGQDARLFAHPYDAIAPVFSEGAFFATTDFVRTHPDLVRTFREVIASTARWANANQPATAKILEKYSGVPASDLVHRVTYNERLEPRLFQPLIDAAARYGLLKAPFPAADLLATQ